MTAQSRSAGVTVAAVLAATAALGACGEETADPRNAVLCTRSKGRLGSGKRPP